MMYFAISGRVLLLLSASPLNWEVYAEDVVSVVVLLSKWRLFWIHSVAIPMSNLPNFLLVCLSIHCTQHLKYPFILSLVFNMCTLICLLSAVVYVEKYLSPQHEVVLNGTNISEWIVTVSAFVILYPMHGVRLRLAIVENPQSCVLSKPENLIL